MKRATTVTVMILALALLSGTAVADTVDFSTSGILACNGVTNCTPPVSTNTVTIGDATNFVTITFWGSGGLVTSPTNVSFGTFNILVGGTGAGIVGGPLLFTLTINQTVPTAGSSTLSGAVQGTIFTQVQTDGTIVFSISTSTATIGPVTYAVVPLTQLLVPPNTLQGLTSLQGQVTTVPEPASMLLLGSGLLGAGSLMRRKFGKK